MRGARLIVLLLAALFGYAYGVYSGYSRDWTFRALLPVWRAAMLSSDSQHNEHGQLVRYPKREIACPPQTARTMVAVTLGQSNAGNHLGRRYAGKPNVVNFFDGRCFEAVDPLLGSSGTGGTQWVVAANRIAERFDYVILVPMAVNSSRVADWLGDLNPMLTANLRTLHGHGYTATHVLWHQGESDIDTSTDGYRTALRSLVSQTRVHFPQSSFFVAIASYCQGPAGGERVRAAQLSVVDPALRIFAGPDGDRYTALEDRSDGCHFSGVAQEKLATDWAGILSKVPPTR